MTTRIKLAVAFVLLAALVAGAPQKKSSRKEEAPHATVAGTVFRDPGFAQPGAAVVLTRKDDPKAKKLQEAASDARGDFAFRVPPGPAAYIVTASLKGFKTVQQEIAVSGEEYVNATLVLVPESNK